MDPEASNDVMSIGSTDTVSSSNTNDGDKHEEKPLMKLFKRLIGNDTKQNTVLTNAQIVDILQREFDMDISYLHDLEIEIYLNLMKKFLKDWPQWDEFDKAIQVLKSKNEDIGKKKMLDVNYTNLKRYLNKMLATAAPMLADVIKEVKEEKNNTNNQAADDKSNPNEKKIDNDSVVLEVHCTRSQLNQLFFRRPHPELNNTIFNTELLPTKITAQTFAINTLLNWPDIRININLGSFSLKRDSKHILKHVLVNKKLNNVIQEPKALKTNLQEKYYKVKMKTTLHLINERLEQIATANTNAVFQEFATAVCDLIKSDIASVQDQISIPSSFRRNLNKYPYVRYLYTEVKAPMHVSTKYDLQLQETMIPQFLLRLSKFEYARGDIPEDGHWLTIDCLMCKTSFSGVYIAHSLKMHFEECHQDEPNWQCTNCKLSFYTNNLANNKWLHACQGC